MKRSERLERALASAEDAREHLRMAGMPEPVVEAMFQFYVEESLDLSRSKLRVLIREAVKRER